MSELLHIYTRVSTVTQAEAGMSLAIQQQLGIEKAKELGFGYKVWNEGGKSSNHEEINKRPVLSQVLTAIRAGEVKHLFVYDQSRLSRNDYVSSVFRFECNKQSVTMYNKDGKYDLGNPQDQFMKQVLDAIAQFDNAQRTERTRLGKLSRIRTGFWMGGPPPFGYRIEDRRLIVDDKEAVWVVNIFEAYARHVSTIDIKDMLDSAGVLTRRKHTSWSLGSIQALLRNTHYVGFWNYTDKRSGELIRIECPAILTNEQYQNAKLARERNSAHKNTIANIRHFYLLRGILRCGHCGRWLSGAVKNGSNEGNYNCPSRERQWSKRKLEPSEKWVRGRSCSMNRSLQLEDTERLIWQTVIDVLTNSTAMKGKIDETYPIGKSKSAVELEIAKEEKELQNIESGFARLESNRILNRLTIEQYTLIRSQLDSEQIRINAKLEQLQDELHNQTNRKNWLKTVRDLQRQLSSESTPEKKRDFLLTVLSSIDVFLVDPRTHRVQLNFRVPLVTGNESAKIRTILEGRVDDPTSQFDVLLDRPEAKKNIARVDG